MSVFIVSDKTMQQVVSAMHCRHLGTEAASQLGRELFQLNHLAVQARYGDDVEPPPECETWTWKPNTPHTCPENVPSDTAVACRFLRAMDCLRYQTDEPIGTHRLLEQLYGTQEQYRRAIIRRMPEYREADWD